LPRTRSATSVSITVGRVHEAPVEGHGPGGQRKLDLWRHGDEEETLGEGRIEGGQCSTARIAHGHWNLERRHVGREGWEVAGGPRGVGGSTDANNVSKKVPLG
jgi:hypothetical protein